MTTKEFSDAFDTLMNGVFLDEYEKSLFLTQAQEQIVIELYTGRNTRVSSFEGTEELRVNLKSLIRTDTPKESKDILKGISKYSKFFTLPKDVLFITYETATLADESAGCKNGSEISIIPVTQDEFHKVMDNPFRWASERKALRLDNGSGTVEIVTKYNIKDYTIRYLSRPTPIVLANLSEPSIDGVSINTIDKITECELDPVMHRYILERAVALAKASRSTQDKSNV